jgi:hypothetical protein
VAVILLKARVALFLINSCGGCNPIKSQDGYNLLEAVVALFLFNGYNSFIPVNWP